MKKKNNIIIPKVSYKYNVDSKTPNINVNKKMTMIILEI